MKELDLEHIKLSETVTYMEQQLSMKQQIPRYIGKELVEQALDDQRQLQIQALQRALPSPYFGRIDFQEQGKEDFVPYYIGKHGVEGENQQILVVDWRAPLASMFYSFSGASSQAEYVAPEGLIEGEIALKRHLHIREQELERLVDSYTKGEEASAGGDEYLLSLLEEKKDSKLRDIVSTIQQEQDQMIRAQKDQAVVIQGVPGSGKTTVALHRLAFLLYQYQEQLKPEKMIIFAPNRMFLDYISDVLPELGVGGVQQTTFWEWAQSILEEPITFGEDSEKTQAKGSLEYKEALGKWYHSWTQTRLPKKAIPLWRNKEISLEMLEKWFTQEYRHEPFAKRIERIAARLERQVEMEHRDIRGLDPRGQWKKEALKLVRSTVKSWKVPKVTDLYRQFHKEYWSEKSKTTWEWSDLAPLLFLHQQIYGVPSQWQYQHVVIDEAQDYSPFQMEVLKRHARGSSFTILGDLLQTIYPERGIHHWEQFLSLFPTSRSILFRLTRSYRSTQQIIHFANKIIAPFVEQELLAEAVSRAGEFVTCTKGRKQDEQTALLEKLADLKRKGHKTIAIIVRDEKTATDWYNWLQAEGIEIQQLSSHQDQYMGGISIVPIPLSKGMEFDAVLLVDVNKDHYPMDEHHAKLLFVGCTRALHELHLFTAGEVSYLIPSEIESDSK